MLQGRFSWCFTAAFWKASKCWTPETQQNIFYEVNLKHTLLPGAMELNLSFFKVQLGITAWVLDHSFCSFQRNGVEAQFCLDHGIEIWAGSSSGILCNKPVFLVHVAFRLFGTRLSHGMGCWQDRTRPNTCISFSMPWKSWCPWWSFWGGQQGDKSLIMLPKLHPILNFLFVFSCVLKAQLSQVLEEVGNHKQRAEMVSTQFLPFFPP